MSKLIDKMRILMYNINKYEFSHITHDRQGQRAGTPGKRGVYKYKRKPEETPV